MNQQQLEILTLISYQLRKSVNDQYESHEHTVTENGKETTYQVNREQHLEEIMKWVVQQLNNNFKLED
ncbi:pathogenicity island protein [Staphylococcus sp. GDY8P131P]|uniref:TscA family type II toxin-antitoxin system antitoxin n=1 Tax=Staphylococcus sp. GDY8P131P TaxID=2804159 RepID=UPI001AEBEB7C|nr:pathogenicity island protein [Staphylococcus sp. GDY8P131P]